MVGITWIRNLLKRALWHLPPVARAFRLPNSRSLMVWQTEWFKFAFYRYSPHEYRVHSPILGCQTPLKRVKTWCLRHPPTSFGLFRMSLSRWSLAVRQTGLSRSTPPPPLPRLLKMPNSLQIEESVMSDTSAPSPPPHAHAYRMSNSRSSMVLQMELSR